MKSRKARAIVLSLGQAVAKLVGLIVMMVMARMLTKGDLAAYRQTILAYMVVAPLLELGIGQGIYYFLPSEKKRVRGRVIDSVAVLGITGLLFAIFIAFGGNQILANQFSNPQIAQLLLWMIPYTIITTPAAIFSSVLVARNKVMQASIFEIVRQLSIGASTIIPILIWQGAQAPLIGNVVASVLFGLQAIILMIKSTPKGDLTPCLDGMKEMASFSVPLGVAGMLGTISLQLDKLIVGTMCSPEEFAIFTVGAFDIPFLSVVTGSVAAVLLSDMRNAIASGNRQEALRLFRITAEQTSLLIFPVAIFLFVCSRPFIETLFSTEYSESAELFRLYLLKLPYRIVIFGAILMALGESKFILKRSFLSLLFGCGVKIGLVWWYGPIGAIAGALAVAYLYVVPTSLRRIAKGTQVSILETIPLKSLVTRVLYSIPVGLLALVALYLAQPYPPMIQLIAATALVGPYCLWWWNGTLYDQKKILAKARNLLGRKS